MREINFMNHGHFAENRPTNNVSDDSLRVIRSTVDWLLKLMATNQHQSTEMAIAIRKSCAVDLIAALMTLEHAVDADIYGPKLCQV